MDWPLLPLGDLCDLITDGTHHSPPNGPSGPFKYVTAKNVRPWGLDLTDISYVNEAVHKEIFARCPVAKNDVLYIKDGVTTGLAVVNPLDEAFSMLSSVALLRPRSGVLDPDFLRHWLNSPATFAAMTGNMTGTAIKRLVLRQIRSALAPVPPIAEQKRIVAKIEELTARSRRAKEVLNAVPPLLDQLRQSILAAAFRGDLTAAWRSKNPNVEPATQLLTRIRAERRARWEAAELAKMAAKQQRPENDKWKERYVEAAEIDTSVLPELPAGWCWQSLDQLLAEGLANGRSVPTDDTGFPVLRLTALRHGQIDLRERKGGAWSAADAEPFLVQRDDFLVSRGNGSLTLVGRGGLVEAEPDGVAFPDTLIRIRVHSLLDRKYLAQVWNSRLVRDQIERSAKTTAGIFKVSQGDLEAVAIPVPDVREQRQIALLVSSMMERVRRLEVLAANESTRAAALEASLLAKAFRGELVPQDPNDEPASVLLERIRAARDIAEPPAPAPRRRASRADQPAAATVGAVDVTAADSKPSSSSSTQLTDLDESNVHAAAFTALWTHGPLEKDAAVRRVADHLRQVGHVDFQRLRVDGPLYGQVLDAIESAVKAGRLDRPRRGHVRACKPDATAYTSEDWRHALVTSLGTDPTDREDAIRAAAEWARENLGLDFTRLRGDGHIVEGLRSAINSAIRRGEVVRHDATRISRTPATSD